MPLKQVVGLAKLVNQPILPAELLRYSEEELLAIHQGLRHFANVCANPGGTAPKLQGANQVGQRRESISAWLVET